MQSNLNKIKIFEKEMGGMCWMQITGTPSEVNFIFNSSSKIT